MDRELVYETIDRERDYQDILWPVDASQKKTPAEFAVYMQQYVSEGLNHLTHNPGYDGLLAAIRKVTALGVACLEQFGAPQRSNLDFAVAKSRRDQRE